MHTGFFAQYGSNCEESPNHCIPKYTTKLLAQKKKSGAESLILLNSYSITINGGQIYEAF
jgi:hypothetical protein